MRDVHTKILMLLVWYLVSAEYNLQKCSHVSLLWEWYLASFEWSDDLDDFLISFLRQKRKVLQSLHEFFMLLVVLNQKI